MEAIYSPNFLFWEIHGVSGGLVLVENDGQEKFFSGAFQV
jgi:hypothetical protein